MSVLQGAQPVVNALYMIIASGVKKSSLKNKLDNDAIMKL